MEVITDFLDYNEIRDCGGYLEMDVYIAGTKWVDATTKFDHEILNLVRNRRWSLSKSGYIFSEDRYGNPRLLWLHQLILPRKDGLMADHINGDKMDNRKDNLRYADNAQNQWNTDKVRGNSDFKGVSYITTRGVWRGYVKCRGVVCNKNFKTEEAAYAWTCKKRNELHGEFANHGN